MSVLQVSQGNSLRCAICHRTARQRDRDTLPLSSLRLQILQILVDDQMSCMSLAYVSFVKTTCMASVQFVYKPRAKVLGPRYSHASVTVPSCGLVQGCRFESWKTWVASNSRDIPILVMLPE